jgi:hypothetical protein
MDLQSDPVIEPQGLGQADQAKTDSNAPSTATGFDAAASVPTITVKTSLKDRLFGAPVNEFNGSHYLLMYAISLGLLASVLSGLASLLEICFNYVAQSDNSGVSYFSGYTTKMLAWLIIGLVVSVPIYLWLMFRLRKTQSDDLPVFTRRVRSFLFGAFMTVLGLVTVTSFANIIYSVVVQFLPKDGFQDAGHWWVGTAQAVLMTFILAGAFWYQLKAFRSRKAA